MLKTLRFRYSFLLFFLVLTLVVYPYLDRNNLSGKLLVALWVAILITSVYAASQDRKHVFIGCFLLLPGFIGHFLTSSGVARALDQNPHLLSLPLYIFVIWTMLHHLMRVKWVTGDILCGAASVYILTGIAWVPLYIMVENTVPGSFSLPPDANSELGGIWDDFVYFSFTTLTTLGYGDISPRSAPARSLTNLEALNGVLYIAVLMSKLVALNVGINTPEES